MDGTLTNLLILNFSTLPSSQRRVLMLAKELENVIEKMITATKNFSLNPSSEENKDALKKAAKILKMITQLAYGLKGRVGKFG